MALINEKVITNNIFNTYFDSINIHQKNEFNYTIDMNGHIIHIDFGSILGIVPWGINFERASFILMKEYMEIMGGKDSL